MGWHTDGIGGPQGDLEAVLGQLVAKALGMGVDHIGVQSPGLTKLRRDVEIQASGGLGHVALLDALPQVQLAQLGLTRAHSGADTWGLDWLSWVVPWDSVMTGESTGCNRG